MAASGRSLGPGPSRVLVGPDAGRVDTDDDLDVDLQRADRTVLFDRPGQDLFPGHVHKTENAPEAARQQGKVGGRRDRP